MGDFRAPHLYSQYARLLRKVDRGQALWDPSPDVIANGDERIPDPVVEIGHLGYEEGGKWHHILDVHRSQQEQHTPGHIPASLFEQIPRPLISSSEPVGPHHFTPHSSTELKLDTTGTTANATATGPTLALKLTHNASLTSFGRSQRDQVRRLELGNYKAYALRNLHYWEHIIRKNDWSISVHKFGIVVDRTLASSWAVTVKTEQSLDATLGAQIAICGTANGDLMLSFSHTSSAGLLSNYGPYSRLRALPPQSDLTSEKFFPSDDSPAISGPLDQCLFVKCITVADLAWYRRLQASIQALFPSENMISRSKASPSIHSQSLSYSDFTTYLSGERIAGDNLPYEAFKIPRDTGDLLPELHGLTDLSTAVLRYVFQQSNVERAVFHDDDILPYMKDISEKESWLTALSRICPRIYKYQYDDCTVGSLSELNFGTPIRKPGSFSHVPWNNFHALLIGIDKYKTYDDLDGAVRDVQAMEEFITGAFDVPSGFKLDITTLVNEQATSTNIVDAIARLKLNKKIKQNDTILIHYAGHGATMPPPEGWPGWTSIPPEDGYPPDVEIQCVVAHDAEVSADSSGLYFAKGVVPDRTLNVLLRDLADAKGNNITVILDCCHSGSGTRNPRASRERAVQLRDPFDKRVTISGRHHREIWGPFFARGAVLDWQYRHAGLGSHVLLAACGKKEVASDGSSFTQAIVAYCRKVYLDELSYTTLIDGIGKLGSRLSPQNPLCEGNNVKSILFDLKDTHLGRLTFDVTMDKQKPVLNAGAMLGITKGMVFDVFTSKVISLREELIGKFTVTRVGATSSTLEGPGGVKADISTAVASPSAAMSDVFPVCAPDPALCETVRLAVQKEPQEDQYGRPSISVEANYLMGEPDITVDHDMQNGIYFAHQLSSNAGRYGLKRLQFALPATLADPEPVRRVLRAAAHFFHHLRTTPINTGVLLGSLIEVRLHELEETREIALVHGRLTRVLNPTRQIRPREDGAYEVHAARADEDADTATRYGIELVNGRLQHGLFAWMFFFDCSTLQILPYHEPRVAKGSSAVDPTLPPMEDNEEPIPVALNYRDGAGKVLRLQLYEKQELDVGFLRIYLSTKYHGGALSGIVQNPPLMLDQGVWRGSKERGGFRGPTPPTQPGRSAGDSVPDLWDVITIPLIQRAKQEKGDL